MLHKKLKMVGQRSKIVHSKHVMRKAGPCWIIKIVSQVTVISKFEAKALTKCLNSTLLHDKMMHLSPSRGS